MSVHPPYRCPECGESAWKADYYEAVWQTVALLDIDGEPVLCDYTGVTGTYDDPSTDDVAFVCRSCDHRIELGSFVLVAPEAENVKLVLPLLEELRVDCEYDAEGDSTVDALIAYKDALEDLLGRVVAARGLPPSEVPAGPETGS